jgi:hypothetical protein
MQNKANFRKAQMNVNSFITKDYRKNDAFAVQKNKPNSNPNKTNLKRAKMDVNIYYTEVYENILCIRQSRKANPNKANFKRDDGFSAHRPITPAIVSIRVKQHTRLAFPISRLLLLIYDRAVLRFFPL